MDSPILRIPRRGCGTPEDPWRWSGRCLVLDVDGDYVASVGGTFDIEAELYETAAATEGPVLLRILIPGRRRATPPKLDVHLLRDAGSKEGQVLVRLRGDLRRLGRHLGCLLPRNHYVTIEAYRKEAQLSTIEADLVAQRDLERTFEAFLARKFRGEVFTLREVKPGMGRMARSRLQRVAMTFAARGIVEAVFDGKRQAFIVRHSSNGSWGESASV